MSVVYDESDPASAPTDGLPTVDQRPLSLVLVQILMFPLIGPLFVAVVMLIAELIEPLLR
jgi:hypothetical protein